MAFRGSITIGLTKHIYLQPNALHLGDIEITAKNMGSASGPVHKPLEVKGQKILKGSEDFPNHIKLPKRNVRIGTGYIGMEFAQMAARAGSRAIVLDPSERPLVRSIRIWSAY